MASSSGHSRPPTDVDPKKKESKGYLLSWARYINDNYYSTTGANSLYWGFGEADIMTENREYGAARQANEKYMRALDIRSDGVNNLTGSQRNPPRHQEAVNYMNLNWDVKSILPKIRHIVINKFMAIDHSVDFTDLSKEVQDKKLLKKWKLYLQTIDKDTLDILKEAQGIDPDQQPQEESTFLPSSKEELDLYEKTGGLKTAAEIANKKISIANFQDSDWPRIKRMMLGDYFDVSIMACKDYRDKTTGRIKTRYVDPLFSGISYSRHFGSNKSPYAFEYRYYTIAEVRAEFPDITEEELIRLSQSNRENYGNQTFFDNIGRNVYNEVLGFTSYWYDDVRIQILDFEILTVDTETYVSRKTIEGMRFHTERYGKKYNNSKTREILEKTVQNVYKGKWIVNSDRMWDYGKQYDIPRPSDSEARLSFHFEVSDMPSMVEQMKGDIDDMILAGLRMQNVISKAADPGIAIEYGALEGMNLGNGDDAKPLEIMRVYQQTGNLFYRSQTHKGVQMRQGGSGMPFKELVGGLGNALSEFITFWEFKLRIIQQTTGLNDVSDGSSPNPEVTRGQAELAYQSSNNALSSIYGAYKQIKKDVALTMALRTQIAIRNDNRTYSAYLPVVGTNSMEVVKMTKEHTLAKLGITITMRASEPQKQEFIKMAQLAMQNKELSWMEYQVLLPYIEEGRIEEATALVAYLQNKRKEQEAQANQANITLQGQQQVQLEETKAKIAQASAEAEVKREQSLSDIRVSEHDRMKKIDHTYNTLLENQKGDKKLEQIQETSEGKLDQIQETSDGKIEQDALNNKADKSKPAKE